MSGCVPLYHAFKNNSNKMHASSVKPTVAEGITVAQPVRGRQIIEAVRKSNGDFLTVNDNKIEDALHAMYNRGFYIEPTAAAAIAGVKRYMKTV